MLGSLTVAMLIDSRELDSESLVQADVAIVGAGAAGITLALELEHSGLDVALLESGGFEPDGTLTRLYEGDIESTLKRYMDRYLYWSRQRFFGGTTNHWGGQCRPLDPIDFERRSWIPESGWPISWTELERYYERAATWVEITPIRDQAPPEAEGLFVDPEGSLETRWFHKSPPTRFGERYRSRLVEAERVRLYLHANLLEARTDESGERVESLAVTTLGGRRFRVAARSYVLATGGIENARLLLLSDSVQKRGLGNEHDLVGRFFADHPHVRVGAVFLTAPVDVVRHNWQLDPSRGHRVMPSWVFSEQTQREQQLLNATTLLNPFPPPPDPKFQEAIARVDLGPAPEGAGRRWTQPKLLVTSEVIPDRENRITLGDRRDALGQRRVSLRWILSQRDADEIRRIVELLAKTLGQRSAGRLRIDITPRRPWPETDPGNHHMGTTRMAGDPTRGVVDRDCKVFGVDNLWIAGSSVFSTYGYANPTLTLVALTVRLADHLTARLKAA